MQLFCKSPPSLLSAHSCRPVVLCTTGIMSVIFARITVAEAATIINAAITVIQHTLGLALVSILVYALPKTNLAIAWSVFTRILHSSLWPTLLRADSITSRHAGVRASLFSKLSLIIGLLIVVTGVVTPLGLADGPLLHSQPKPMLASYAPDLSPIGLATSPRDSYTYSRTCGVLNFVPCPGNGENDTTTTISRPITDTFMSTPHGPFSMQFRQYYLGKGGQGNESILTAQLTTLQSLILRDDIFAVEGLIVDLSSERPGIGFWNHTIPTGLSRGGSWTQDVLWLEPVTSCVSANLSIDYMLTNGGFSVNQFNLTDRGGFVNLSREFPLLSRDGQHIDIYQHAYKAAFLSNAFTMRALNNLTREESQIGRAFLLKSANFSFSPREMQRIDMSYLSDGKFSSTVGDNADLQTSCRGYGGVDIANLTNVGVHCGMFLGIPVRTDDGDPRLPGENSTWKQDLQACASVTRARLQTVHFSSNGNTGPSGLQISRRDTNSSVLWAVERSDMGIAQVDPFWGRVDDAYENDPTLSTIRSEVFYVPAGAADLSQTIGPGMPVTVPAATWSAMYSSDSDFRQRYSGEGNFALLTRYRALVSSDPVNGPARIRNLVWVDSVANNMVGSATNATVWVARNQASVSYDLRYGIPVLILFVLWSFSMFGAAFLFLSRSLTFSYLRDLLNHTSMGRVVVGDSKLTVVNNPATSSVPQSASGSSFWEEESLYDNTRPGGDWAETRGRTLVSFESPNPSGLKRGSATGLLPVRSGELTFR